MTKFPWYQNENVFIANRKKEKVKSFLGTVALIALALPFIWLFVDHLAK